MTLLSISLGIWWAIALCWVIGNYIRYKRRRDSWRVIWKGIEFGRKYQVLKSLSREDAA